MIRILDAPNEDTAIRFLQQDWPARTPRYTVPASPAEGRLNDFIRDDRSPVGDRIAAAQYQADLAADRAFAGRMQDVLLQDAGVRGVRRTEAGWELLGDKGTVVTLESPREVQRALLSLGRARSRTEAERLSAEVEKIVRQDNAEGLGSRHLFRRDAHRFRREGDSVTVESVRDGQARPLTMTPEALASLHNESTALGLREGIIRGANHTLRDDTGRLIRHYETNAGADLSTILHERVETLYKAGGIPAPEIRAAAAHLAAQPRFNPAKIKDPGQRRVAETLRRIARDDPSLTESARRETLVELIVADQMGRFRDGAALEPGSFRTALHEATLAAPAPLRAAFESVQRMMALVRCHLGGMFDLVRGFNRARESGIVSGPDAWSAFAQKLRGAEDHASDRSDSPHEPSYSLGPAEGKAPGLRRNWPDVWKEFPDIHWLVPGRFIKREGDREQVRMPGEEGSVNKDWHIAKGYGNYAPTAREAAAKKLVNRIFNSADRSRPLAMVKFLKAHPGAILMPIRGIQRENRAPNMIPGLFAEHLSKLTALEVDSAIYKTNKESNSDATAWERLTTRHEFAGPVQAGRVYFILDDVSTTGSSGFHAARYIENNGGIVGGIIQLGLAPQGQPKAPGKPKPFRGDEHKLAMTDETRTLLRSKANDTILNETVQNLGIAHDWRELPNAFGRILADHWERARAVSRSRGSRKDKPQQNDPAGTGADAGGIGFRRAVAGPEPGRTDPGRLEDAAARDAGEREGSLTSRPEESGTAAPVDSSAGHAPAKTGAPLESETGTGGISFSLAANVVESWVDRQTPIKPPQAALLLGRGEIALQNEAQNVWASLPNSSSQ